MADMTPGDDRDGTCADAFARLIIFDEARSELRGFESAERTPLKILVVDDEIQPVRVLRSELERQGHAVVVAHDGREALSILEREDFDCSFIDVMMPYVDGYTVLRWIRNHPTKSGMWVALMSAMASEIDGYTRDWLGADYYVHKPIEITDLFPKD